MGAGRDAWEEGHIAGLREAARLVLRARGEPGADARLLDLDAEGLLAMIAGGQAP